MTVLVCLSGLGSLTVSLHAQTTVALSQVSTLGKFPSGVQSSGNYAGTAMVIDQQGDLIAAEPNGQDLVSFNLTTGVSTKLADYTNVGTVAIDAQNNLYISTLYDTGQNIVKIPYVNGAYVAISSPSSSTPACTGSDTVECYLPNLTDAADGYYIQIRTMTFDAAGDLFIGSGEGQILECTAACLTTGTPQTAVLYTVPTQPSTNGATFVPGPLAIDADGNLFFTESDYYANGSTSYVEYSYVSNLKELKYTPGTGYAASATLLYSYVPATQGSGPASDEITGLTIANSTIYFTTLYDGTFALTDTAGVVTPTTPYAVSTQGGEVLATNGAGQFYVDSHNSTTGSEDLVQINIGDIALPSATDGGTPSTATNVTAFLNDGPCSTPETITFAGTGTDGGDFTATAGTTCTSTLTGYGSYPVTVTFTPTGSGNETGTLTATDSDGNSGAATVTGFAVTAAATPAFTPVAGTYTAVETVTITSATAGSTIYYTIDGTTPTTSSTSLANGGTITVAVSETVKAIAVKSGLSDSQVATAAYVINIPVAGTPTFSPGAGTYKTTLTVGISSSATNATIYYTTDGTVPTTASTSFASGGTIAVVASETVMAFAVAPGYTPSAISTASYVISIPPANAAPPTFTPVAGAYLATQTVTLTSTTPGATIYYTTDGVTIPNISSPTVASGGTITISASETVMASALAPGGSFGPVSTAVYQIGVPPQRFLVGVNPGTLSVDYGSSGTISVSLTPVDVLTSPVTFACSGLPSGSNCTFAPATITTAGTTASTTVLTVTPPASTATTSTSAALGRGSFPFLPGGTVAAAALCMFGLRRRRGLRLVLMLMLSVGATGLFMGCSTGNKPAGPAIQATTTSTVTVTATSGTSTDYTTFDLTVQPAGF